MAMGHNDHLNAFLQFYAQSEPGNAPTRRLESAFAKRTYPSISLARNLLPALLAGDPRWTVPTGNAGDGKTTFTQTVERLAQAQEASLKEVHSGGRDFTLMSFFSRHKYIPACS